MQTQIHTRYTLHRLTRTAQQRSLLLSPTFPGPRVDTTLRSMILNPHASDPRNNLVFWARPPQRIRTLVSVVQAALRDAVPDEHTLWLMPEQNLHMTVLEMAHSLAGKQGEEEVTVLSERLKPALGRILEYPAWLWEGKERNGERRAARLSRPMVMYDDSALALSFLPVVERAGDTVESSGGHVKEQKVDREGEAAGQYTYHHLRRDLWDIASTAVPVASRYVVPSAHLTIGRFVGDEGADAELMLSLIGTIENINEDLQGKIEGPADSSGEWIVGEERPMELRAGSCWYGEGGWTVRQGKAISR